MTAMRLHRYGVSRFGKIGTIPLLLQNTWEEKMYKELFESLVSGGIDKPFIYQGTVLKRYAFAYCTSLVLRGDEFPNVTTFLQEALSNGPTGILRLPNAVNLAGRAFTGCECDEVYLDKWTQQMNNTFYGANISKVVAPMWTNSYFGASVDTNIPCEFFFGNCPVDTMITNNAFSQSSKGSVYHFGTTGYKVLYDTDQAAWVKVADD